MKNNSTQKVSSIFPNGEHEPIRKNYVMLPTVAIIGTLIVCFVIIKKFIYIKDEKRQGK
jgi:hypothetical protein